jgi:hypothetical protein
VNCTYRDQIGKMFNDTSWAEVFHDNSRVELFHDTSWIVKFYGKDPDNPEGYGDPNYEANNAPSTQRSFGRAIEFAL